MKIRWIAALLGCLFPLAALCTETPIKDKNPLGEGLYNQHPWMLTYYYGITADNTLISILAGHFNRWPEHIQSAELAKTLDQDNIVRQFFYPVVSVVQFAGVFSVRNGSYQHRIYEFNPYLAFRWANFPWNHYLTTSLAIGEGVSYASSVPGIEKRNNQNTKRLLNYLMFEVTFALPRYPQWQLIARIHHRSGAFGLYHAGNSGSNVVGLGLRYLFD